MNPKKIDKLAHRKAILDAQIKNNSLPREPHKGGRGGKKIRRTTNGNVA